jgi:hypothetical protein
MRFILWIPVLIFKLLREISKERVGEGTNKRLKKKPNKFRLDLVLEAKMGEGLYHW